MPSEKALALVIRSVDFSETSQVVTIFSREIGKLAALAKGARRLKGPFAGALDLLSVCRIVLIRKHSDSLDLLTEAELVKGFARQRNSLPILYAGFYIAELLSELTDDYDPHPALFDATVESLQNLEAGVAVWSALRRFEFRLLREIGHAPELERCVPCGRAVETGNRVAFSAAAGGVVCASCQANARDAIPLRVGSLRAAVTLANPSGDQWRRLHVPEETEREIRAVTESAIGYLVGRSLRTARFLRE